MTEVVYGNRKRVILLFLIKLLIIRKNYSGTEIPVPESRPESNVKSTNMIKNFFFCESGFLPWVNILTISKFYGSSIIQNLSCFSCPVPYKAYLSPANQLFKTSYNTVVCETKESWFSAWNFCIKTINNSGSFFPLLSWSPRNVYSHSVRQASERWFSIMRLRRVSGDKVTSDCLIVTKVQYLNQTSTVADELI